MNAPSQRAVHGLAGLAIVLFGAWFLWQATSLRSGPGYAAIGPRTFPILVGLGLLGSGLGVLAGALRLRDEREPAHTEAEGPGAETVEGDTGAGTDWPTLLGIAGLLALYLALYRPLGFILASSALLPAGARILGSRAQLRDVIAGLVVSVVTYLVFTRLLGLELPAGPLAAPLGGLLG